MNSTHSTHKVTTVADDEGTWIFLNIHEAPLVSPSSVFKFIVMSYNSSSASPNIHSIMCIDFLFCNYKMRYTVWILFVCGLDDLGLQTSNATFCMLSLSDAIKKFRKQFDYLFALSVWAQSFQSASAINCLQGACNPWHASFRLRKLPTAIKETSPKSFWDLFTYMILWCMQLDNLTPATETSSMMMRLTAPNCVCKVFNVLESKALCVSFVASSVGATDNILEAVKSSSRFLL